MPDRRTLTGLRRLFSERFSESDLRNLCFDLGIDYDDLRGEGRSDKARELIICCRMRHRVRELVETARQIRPDIVWDGVE